MAVSSRGRIMTAKSWNVTKTGKGEQRTRARGTVNEKWGTNRELEMNLLTGVGLKLGFVPTFHFPVPRGRSLF